MTVSGLPRSLQTGGERLDTILDKRRPKLAANERIDDLTSKVEHSIRLGSEIAIKGVVEGVIEVRVVETPDSTGLMFLTRFERVLKLAANKRIHELSLKAESNIRVWIVFAAEGQVEAIVEVRVVETPDSTRRTGLMLLTSLGVYVVVSDRCRQRGQRCSQSASDNRGSTHRGIRASGGGDRSRMCGEGSRTDEGVKNEKKSRQPAPDVGRVNEWKEELGIDCR